MQVQLREEKTVERKTYSELIFEQLRDIKEEMRRNKRDIDDRFERLERRLDRLETKLERQEDKQSGDTRHSQILTGTTISIALAVIYSILK